MDIHDGKLVALLSDFDYAKDFDDTLPDEPNVPLHVSTQPAWAALILTTINSQNIEYQDIAGEMWVFGRIMVEVILFLNSFFTVVLTNRY